MTLNAVEIRVLGCLVEKQRTTPDVYPLSVNALRLACNQSTNRDPVVDYDEPTIRAALDALADRRWARLASGPGSRAAKYRHLLDDALSLDDAEISLLCVLMLRGPQTVGEVRGRTGRLHEFADLAEVESTLDALARRDEPLVTKLPRRPGQKDARYAHLLAGAPPAEEPSAEGPAATPARETAGEKVARLEAEVEGLRSEVAELRRQFDEFRRQFE